MKKIFWLFVIFSLVFNTAGCGRMARVIKVPHIKLPEGRERQPLLEDVNIEHPLKAYRVGEKLTYGVRWMGIYVGQATLSVKETAELNGTHVYHIVSEARSNAFLDKIYKVRDEIHSYVDKEGLFSRKFEKHQREGRYKADEEIVYDYINKKGYYKSFTTKAPNIGTKEIELQGYVQDALSCLYYFRLQDIDVGKTVFIKVNADEKDWDLEVKVLDKAHIEMRGMGVYEAVLVEPKAQFKGIFARKGRMEVWFSADRRRLPLLMNVHIPIPLVGLVSVALEKIE